jgi:hypothetical protein
MDKKERKLIIFLAVITLCVMLNNNLMENQTSNQKDQTDTGSEIGINSNEYIPMSAKTDNYNIHPYQDTFAGSDVFSANTWLRYEWSPAYQASAVISHSTILNKLEMTAALNDSNLYYYSMELNLNLVSVNNFASALIDIDWDVDFPNTETDDWAHWQYQINGGAWQNFSIADESWTDADRSGPESWDISGCGLTGSETSFRIRLYTYMRSISYIEVFDVDIMTLESTITDNTGLGGVFYEIKDLEIEVAIDIFGDHVSGLSTTATQYRIYYTLDGSAPDQGDSYLTPDSGSFASYAATFNYTLAVTENQTAIRYRLGIYDLPNTYYYWGPVETIDIADRMIPTFGPVTLNTSGNASDGLTYDDHLRISGSVNDAGGLNLRNVECFVKIGGSPGSVSRTDFDHYLNTSVSGTSDTYIFDIDTQYLTAEYTNYIRLYVFDNGYNIQSTWEITIEPQDLVNPSIVFVSDSSDYQDGDVSYDETFYLIYNATEPAQASGLAPGPEGLLLCWKLGSVPSTAIDHIGTAAQAHDAHNQVSYMEVVVDNFNLNDVIYFWVNGNDSSGNRNSTYTDPKQFTVVDRKSPTVAIGANSLNSLNYSEDRNVSITVSEPAKASGLVDGSVKLYYKINNNTLDENVILLNHFEHTGSNWKYRFNASQYVYGNIIYIWVNSTDNIGNFPSNPYLGSISIVDDIEPTLQLISKYPYTNISFARKFYDINISVLAFDGAGGAGLKNVTLAYNSTLFSWDVPHNYTTIAGIHSGSNNYSFLITKDNIAIGSFYFIIRCYDNSGNYKEITNLPSSVLDQKTPHVSAYNLGDSPNIYLKSGKFLFTFNITQNSLMNLYLNNTLLTPIPFSGYSFGYNFNITGDGKYIIRVVYFNITQEYPFYLDTVAPKGIDQSSMTSSYSNSQVSLGWKAPTGSESEALTYHIYRGTSKDFSITDTSQATKVGTSDSVSYVDAFSAAGIYYYKIYAVDKAGNEGPVSKSVSVTVTGPNWIYYLVGVGAAALIATVVVVKVRSKGGKTLKEKGINRNFVAESDGKSKDSMWEDNTESAPEEEIEWEDIGTDAYSTPTDPTTPIKGAIISSAGGAGSTGGDPTSRFDAEMSELYENAQEFAEFGQESMASKSYEMLLRLAEKKGDPEMKSFIQKKMDELYQ